jgi:hypothetical protein
MAWRASEQVPPEMVHMPAVKGHAAGHVAEQTLPALGTFTSVEASFESPGVGDPLCRHCPGLPVSCRVLKMSQTMAECNRLTSTGKHPSCLPLSRLFQEE